MGDMLVLIRWQDRNVAVPLSQLTAIDADKSPSRPSATGITGWRRATASEPLLNQASLRSSRGSLHWQTEDEYGETSVEITTHLDRG